MASRIEDNGSFVRDNLLAGRFDEAFVGAPFRARLAGEPVHGIPIEHNNYDGPGDDSFAENLQLVPDEQEAIYVSAPRLPA